MTNLNTVTPNGTIYGYARVSTVQQDLSLQIDALLKAGVPAENLFTEKMSGKNTKDRPEWQKLEGSQNLKEGEPMNGLLKQGDTLMVSKLDRLGRSVSDVTRIVDKFEANGIFLVVLDSGIDTRKRGDGMEALMTKALITLLSLMAEMERTFIIERTKPAIADARQRGVKFGRPQTNKNLYQKAVKEYIDAHGTKTVPQIIAEYGCDESGKDLLTQATFFRHLKKYKQEHGIN